MREPIFQCLPQPRPVPLAGRNALVLGLGDTGLSMARWIALQGGRVRAADTRAEPPRAADLRGALPGAEARCGAFELSLLEGIDLVCVSPGLSLEEPVVQEAALRKIPVLGDIELFAWALNAQAKSGVIAVTGTNGKTTVTSLTGHLLRSAGIDCEVAGNIGPAALDAWMKRSTAAPAIWVLELSSYQLEITWSLCARAATVLNLSEDHLDRHRDFGRYAAAKQRVFRGDGMQVLNREDARSMACALPGRQIVSFGRNAPERSGDYGIGVREGRSWLQRGEEPLLPLNELPLFGLHNAANALAACALAQAAGAPLESLGAGLRSFRGLPHRVARIALRRGVAWYDDSKGTNVGATVAALEGLGASTLLIAGGEGKGQDFSVLAPAVARHARHVFLIGRDASLIEQALRACGVSLHRCESLEHAVAGAAASARAGDAVLLSPACASFDMFRDYRHRGESFVAAVRALGD
ncbi:MAG: UDP-N-acetylmuramoylalanine--D-glutamate ligase [Betaproteobacteria bacterium RIFCSPLOWO2_02_FULL_66_14]|nr:MAG: UDP-N-acetylmuramoylalanine--D-glutamate ligase [Betaproteobacteria bacterium RIFCSPLOWO2_02_FULL_66_14]